jgi:hypothetical protein
MPRSRQLLLVVVAFWSLQTFASNEISTVLSKSDLGKWRADFSAKQPVKQIAFQRSPDSSRLKRWHATSADFEILKINNDYEAVKRIDGKPFTTVAFDLTPTYIALPKDYAPFSPFSDGGMLVHSGRFFACAEYCAGDLNQWQLTLRAPRGDNIIVGGIVHSAEASWSDSDSGQNIYVGKGIPTADDHFISLIDSKLPSVLKELMAQKLPKILAYFAGKLPPLTYRPSLFASYSTTDDGSYGHQGGTLPGQIFMHWYGNQAIETLKEHETFWFFAHEIAHLYQGPAGNIEPLADAWVHEGTAELFAAIAYTEINGSAQLFQSKLFQSKLTTAKADCLRSLATQQSYHQVALANPRVHYSCGLLIVTALHQELTKRGSDIFQLWQAFNHAVAKGKPATATTFAEVSKTLLSEASYLKLAAFANYDEINAQQYFEELAVRIPPAVSP